MKKLALAVMLGLGVLVSGCCNEQATETLVQMDNGKYTMTTGDDYGINYVKGYSDDKVTNYKIIRVIGTDNNKTVDDLLNYYKNNGFKAVANIQLVGDAVEYKGNIYKLVNASTHVYKGQKIVINSKYKDSKKVTIDGTFKEYALVEVTKVERDNTGHLTNYTVKVVKDMKLVKTNDIEHLEINEED